MTMTTEIMMDALRRVREVHPETSSVSFCLRVLRDDTVRYHASAITGDGGEDDLGGGIVMGYGADPEEALGKLCVRLVELRDARRVRTLCVVCAATGTETVGDITTGDGMMCRKHAIEWLQSEKQESEELSCRDVGPDSTGRWS